jgi:hypothetical protein
MKVKKILFFIIFFIFWLNSAFAANPINIQVDTNDRVVLPETKLTMVFRIKRPGTEDLLYQYPYWVKKVSSQKQFSFLPDRKLLNYIQKYKLAQPIQGNSNLWELILEPVLFTDIGKPAINGAVEPDGYLDSDDIRANLLFNGNGELNFQSSGIVLYLTGDADRAKSIGKQIGFNVLDKKSGLTRNHQTLTVYYTGPQSKKDKTNHHHYIKTPAVMQGVNLCSAASMEMLLYHYQVNKSQYQIATEMCEKGFNPSDACVYENKELKGIYYTDSYQIAAYLNQSFPQLPGRFETVNEKGAVEVTIVEDSIRLLKQSLLNNHPVIVRTCYTNHFPCTVHLRLVTGFDDRAKLVYINEPALKLTAMAMSYDLFFNKLWIVAEQPSGSKRSTRFMVYQK